MSFLDTIKNLFKKKDAGAPPSSPSETAPDSMPSMPVATPPAPEVPPVTTPPVQQ